MRFTLLALVFFTACQAADATYEVSVRLTVSDQQIQNRLQSVIYRELRNLHDVEVSDNNPVYIIRIVALRSQTESGKEVGFSLAVAISGHIILSSDASERALQTLRSEKPEQFLELRLYETSAEKFDETCRQIVADFDSSHMEWSRELTKALTSEWQKATARK